MLIRVFVIAVFYVLLCELLKAEESYLYTHNCDSIVCKRSLETSYSFDKPTPVVLSPEPTELPDKLALAIYATALLMLDEHNVEIKEWKPDTKNELK